MSRFFLIIAEGIHDLAFLGRLLAKHFKASEIKSAAELGSDYAKWIDCSWPKQGDISRATVDAPSFWRRDGDTIILRSAEGIEKVEATLTTDLERVELMPENGPAFAGVALILDSDDSPEKRWREVLRTLSTLKLATPKAFGEVTTGAPRIGAFALPSGASPGTLEDLLLPLGKHAYPQIHEHAVAFVEAATPLVERLKSDEKKLFKKPSGAKKATVAAMAALLKPSKAAHISVKDQAWISTETLKNDALTPIVGFLTEFLK